MANEDKNSVTINTTLLEEQEKADAGDVLVPVNELLALLRAGRVSISSADISLGYLADKLAENDYVKLTLTDAGTTNERLVLGLSTALELLAAGVDGSGRLAPARIATGVAPINTPLVADGAGGAQTGVSAGIDPVDITITAGEAIAQYDFVTVNPATGLAHKMNIDQSGGASGQPYFLRGIAQEAISSSATGLMRIYGVSNTGLTGMTAGERLWATTTDGLYSTTKPALPGNNTHKTFASPGVAISATEMLIQRLPAKRLYLNNSLSNNLSLQVIGPIDVGPPYVRRATAYYDNGTGWRQATIGDASFSSQEVVDVFFQSSQVTRFTNFSGGTLHLIGVVEYP